MKTYNATYSSKEEFTLFLERIEYAKNDAILVQIFAGASTMALLEELIETIQTKINNAVIIGSSTAGEIFEGEMLKESVVVSLSVFEKTRLEIASSMEKDSRAIGEEIAKSIVSKNTKAIILFADGLKCNGGMLLEGIGSGLDKSVIIAGGMSADGSRFEKTFTIHNEMIFEGGAVGVSLNSDSLIIHNSYSLSWKAFGAPMRVTKVEGNRVYEINEKPIIEIYREFLGEDVANNLPNSAVEFPLMYRKGSVELARSMVAIDGEAIIFSGEIPEGVDVRFGVASQTLFAEGNKKLFQSNAGIPLESIFVYSCMGRKMFLGKELEREFKPLRELAPLSGFFTYGELYSSDADYHVLNITTTILGLSESEDVKTYTKEEKTQEVAPLSLSTSALMHLVEKNISYLEIESQEKENTIAMLNQYQNAIDASFIMSQSDLRGNITFANELFCQISGYSLEELLGKPHSIVRHPNVAPSVYKDLWSTLKSKKIWRGTLQNRCKNGSSYYVEATIFPLLDRDGNVLSYVGMRKDVTEIYSQKERAEAILNAQESIVLLVSLENETMNIKELNKKFFDMFDYKDTSDFLSKHSSICELFIEKEGCLSRAFEGKSWVDKLLQDPTKIHLVLVVDKNKQQRVLSAKAKEFRLDAETLIIFTFTDVTELEQARVEALSAEKAKGTFLSTMSHELRTPLNAVIGFSQILMSIENLDREKIRSSLEKINISGKHLLNVVNNILDFSKIDSGKMELQKQSLSIDILLDESILLLETQANEKQIKVKKESSQKDFLFVDAQLMKQVIINLLSNAIKFSPQNSEIVVRYEEENEAYKIKICDQGVGLSDAQIAMLFESFAQIEGHQNEAIKGTGLGLMISKRIVELHGGHIDVESKVGQGSCFSIVLPAQGAI